MNIYNLKEELPAVEEVGLTINAPERMRLEMGLLKLTQIAKSDQLLFWGKIYTNAQPYYIAMAIDLANHYAFPHKRFYYARDNMMFQELPALDEYNKGKADQFNHLPFSGDAANILINVQGEENQEPKEPEKKEEDNDSEEEKVVIVPKNFTELDRLSHLVRAIEMQCQIVPVGAFKMSQKHEVRYNQSFHGLALNNLSLSQFQHFRYPQEEKVAKDLEKADCIFRYDLFDPLENHSHWVLQMNTTECLVTVRNLVWQGYVGYHMVSSKQFGGVYFGWGQKNAQASFYV